MFSGLALSWQRTGRECVYGSYILPIPSLYAWLLSFQFWLPVRLVFPWQAVALTSSVRGQSTVIGGDRTLQTPVAWRGTNQPFFTLN